MRKADPRIESAGYETDGGESSYWIYLSPGFISEGSESQLTHAIHEDTKREAVSEMCWVVPCRCQECLNMIAKQ